MNFLLLNRKPQKGYGFIYRYISPNNKSYIGQTVRSLKERAGYQGKEYENCKVFYSAILKYGYENFEIEILEEVPYDILDEKEKKYIQKFNSIIPNGYNIKEGGSQTFTSSKNRKRICQYDLNGHLLKVYDSMQEAAKETNFPYQRISACCCHKRAQYKNFIFRYYDDKTKLFWEKCERKKGRPTAKLDQNGKILEVFSSAKKAGESLGKDGRNIRLVCEGKRQSAYGFRWKYLD